MLNILSNRKILCILMLISLLIKAEAGIEKFNSILNTPTLNSTSVLTVFDDKYNYMLTHPFWLFEFKNKTLTNRVIFSINHEDQTFQANEYSVELELRITYYSYSGGNFNASSPVNKKLTINFHPSMGYDDKAVYEFSGGNGMKIEVLAMNTTSPVSAPQMNLSLEAEIDVERYYTFNPAFSLSGSQLGHNTGYVLNRGELEIYWDFIPGAEEYDLEWLHVNSYDADGNPLLPSQVSLAEREFNFNCTRISTAYTNYRIPLLYDAGFIVYRVRGIGRTSINNYDGPIEGAWSSPTNCIGTNANVACYSPHYYANSGHEEGLNWQYNISFAEEGKRKAVATYFDGSLRNRQVVSQLNTDDKTIVGESIYDFQGRAAIQALPVPSLNPKLGFQPEFNLNASFIPYNRSNFDIDQAPCFAITDPMDPTIRGASYYYSPSNTDNKGHQAYLPDAKKYPCTQVEYTPDNTGRIRRQGGVGIDHQLGTNHETKYFYGKPFQEELDRLFGSEVGFVKHYKKNMVIDANEQVSVSYLDPAGRVVATGLTGVAPVNLKPLGNTNSFLTIDLLNKTNSLDNSGSENIYDPITNTLKCNFEVLVDSKAEREFTYKLNGSKFEEQCQVQITLPDGTQSSVSDHICYNCIFDLEISMTDECGNEYLSGVGGIGNSSTTIGSGLLHDIQTIPFLPNTYCSTPAPSFNSVNNIVNPWMTNNEITFQPPIKLNVGNYSLHKKLKVNQQALDIYTDNYIENNKCILNLDYFKNWSIANIDFTGCGMSCDDCKDKLGNFDQYDVNVNPACDPCLTQDQYDELLARCFENCKEDNITCESALEALKADMNPNGQYGTITPGNTITNGIITPPSGSIAPHLFPLSVFNESNLLPRKANFPNSTSFGPGQVSPNWRHPYDPAQPSGSQQMYLDDNGNPSYITLISDGSVNFIPPVHASKIGLVANSKIQPQYLANVEDFILAWQPSWANALVDFHPEFCYYEFCVGIEPSHQFDEEWLAIDKVINFSQLPAIVPTDPMQSDPYFNSTIMGAQFYNPQLAASMTHAMSNYKTVNGNMYSMLQVAYMITVCPSYDGTPVCGSQCIMPAGYHFTELGIDNDAVWNTFKSLYISLKQKYQEQHRTKFAIVHSCYNGCIGEDQFDPFLNHFYFTPYSTGAPWSNPPWSFIHFNSQYFNFEQPCNWARWYYYHGKTPRFPMAGQMLGASTLQSELCYDQFSAGQFTAVDCQAKDEAILNETQNLNNMANYGQCGQCPLARDLEGLLNALVNHHDLQNSNVTLSCYPTGYGEFTSAIANSLTTNTPAMTGPFTWNYQSGSSIPHQLFTAIISGASGSCYLSLKFPVGNTIYDFGDIIRICKLESLNSPVLFPLSPGKNFNVKITVKIKSTDPLYNSDFPDKTKEIQLEGLSTCLNIADCSFDPICTPSIDAMNFQNLFNALLYGDGVNTKFNSNSSVNLTAFPFNAVSDLLTETLDGAIDPGQIDQNAAWTWTTSTSGNSLTATMGATGQTGNCSITFTMPSGSSYSIADIKSFNGIKPLASGSGFKAMALVSNASGSTYVDVLGSSTCFNWGDCVTSLPQNSIIGQGSSQLMNSGLMKCDATPIALAFQDYINTTGPGNIFSLGNLVRYSNCQIEINLPVSSGYALTDIVQFSNITPDLDQLDQNGNAYHFIIYGTTSTGILVQFTGFSNCLIVGNCQVPCDTIQPHPDENSIFPIHRGVAVSTHWSANPFDYVVGVYDIRDPVGQNAPHFQNWAAPVYHHPQWTKDRLGDVFGITFDKSYHPNIYLCSSNAYSGLSLGTGGAGAIYKIDGQTGNVSTFANLPNNGISQLGNICFDKLHDQFFVTNFEDGRIYRLNNQGIILSYFDPFQPDDGISGFSPIHERLWGVAYYNDKVYFSLWNTDCGAQINPPYLHNEIYSVLLDSYGNFIGTESLEVSVPFLYRVNYSNPVSDISFSNDGKMLIAERTMLSDDEPNAHSSRILQYEWNGTSWLASTSNFLINESSKNSACNYWSIGSNCAGGVSYSSDKVVVTGDDLYFVPTIPRNLYGITLIPKVGNTINTADMVNYHVDLDGNLQNINLTQIGDVEVYNSPICYDPCQPGELVVNGTFSNGNTSFTSSFSFVSSCVDQIIPLDYQYTLANTYNPLCTYPVLSPTVIDHTTGTGNYLLFCDGDGSSATPRNIWRQQSITVTPNTNYKFGAWVSYIQVYDGSKIISLVVNGLSIYSISAPPFTSDHSWIYIEGIWNSGTATVANLEINSIALDEPITACIDDISFKAVCNTDMIPSSAMCCLPNMGTITVKDSCINELMHIAVHNAEEMYAVYIEEIRSKFQEAYIAKCLNVYEEFQMKIEDAEHQFTLYYYDQAGNLVRTIPPAGVNKITATADLQQIKLDRASSTHTFFTKHTLETTYQYNSLNQLVAQTVPDHDNLDIWKTANANGGIPASHTVHGTKFNDLYNGISYSEDNSGDGHIFTTIDGGTNWAEVSSIGISNLNAVQYVNSSPNIVHAVGLNGTIIKSIDQGNSWNIQASPTTSELIGVHFISGSTGIIVEKNGAIWQTTTGGDSWSNTPIVSLLNLVAAGSITSFEASPNNANLIIAVCNNGKIYRSTDVGLNWTLQSSIRTTDLSVVQFVTSGSWWAIGADGTLIKSIDGENWTEVPNNLHVDLIDFHFRTDLIACAIDINGALYKTLDGGITWTTSQTTLAGGSIIPVVDLHFLDAQNGFAVTTSGLVYKTLNGGASWNVLANGPTGITGIKTLDFKDLNTGIIAGTAGQIYLTLNAGTSWFPITNSFTLSINRIHLEAANTFNVILSDGTVQRYNGAAWANSSLPPDIYEAFHFINAVNGYVIGQSGKIFQTSNGGIIWTQVLIGIAPTGIYKNVYYSSTTLVAVGNQGMIYRSVSGNALQDKSEHVNPPDLRGIGFSAGTGVYITGIDGTILSSNNNGNNWSTQKTGSSSTINDIAFQNTSNGIAVLDNGLAIETTNAGINWTPTSPTNITSNINQIIYSSQTAAYFAAADQCNILQKSAGSPWSNPHYCGGNEAYHSIASNPSVSEIISVGDNGKMVQRNASNTWISKIVKAPVLYDVFMIDNQKGFGVGKKGIILNTINGGTSWSYPQASTISENLNSIDFLNSDIGLIVGNNGSILKTINGGNTWTKQSSPTTQNLNEVFIIRSNAKGVIVGNVGAVLTSSNLLNWTSSSHGSSDLNAVHFSDQNWGYAVGSNGQMFEITNNALSWTDIKHGLIDWNTWAHTSATPAQSVPANTGLNDVYFIDHTTGYAIGNEGTILKTINGGTSWSLKDLPIQNQNDLLSISFVDPYHAYISGTGIGGTNIRSLYDFSDQFSTLFYYDKLGRLVVSQNSKQYKKTDFTYSYTLYDDKGRITEVGELSATHAMEDNYQARVLNDTWFRNWINSGDKTNLTSIAGIRKEVTHTYYDASQYTLPVTQDNLRNRVASIMFEALDDLNSGTYDNAQHFSYDIHGNVKTLLQDVPQFLFFGQQFKRVDYKYDLISGNVLEVNFQKGERDQFTHNYNYDADNRILNAETSEKNNIKDQDAKYFYYQHGPLARTEIGDLKVQGVDNAYTIQGWLKGVNSNTLNTNWDIGKDGADNSTSYLHKNIPKDEYGFTLGYYAGDYLAINTPVTDLFEAKTTGSVLESDTKNLYNGNIGHMVTAIRSFMKGGAPPQAMSYYYDQLNRLVSSRKYDNLETINNKWKSTGVASTDYAEDFSYDPNGNILTLNRNAIDPGIGNNTMDKMTYKYQNISNGYVKNTNKLKAVKDIGDNPDQTAFDDIKENQAYNPTNPTDDNYQYDQIGNLVQDKSEYIQEIKWTTYGKVSQIIKDKSHKLSLYDLNHNGLLDDELVLQDLEFIYDATGNRIMKIVKPHLTQADGLGLSDQSKWKYTYYVRDAHENSLAVYNIKYQAGVNPQEYEGTFSWREAQLYGSSRIGIKNENQLLAKINFSANIDPDKMFSIISNQQSVNIEGIIPPEKLGLTYHNIGRKQYELSNHLSNVLTTVSDRRNTIDARYNWVGVTNGDNNLVNGGYTNVGAGNGDFIQVGAVDGIVSEYLADAVSGGDYYSFGMGMEGRLFNVSSYKFGFNGMEKDNDIKVMGDSYTSEFRQYDPRTSRWLTIDPKPTVSESPYVSMGNDPVLFTDPLGDTIKISGGFFFRWITKRQLSKIVQTDEGKKIFDELHNSTNVFTISKEDRGKGNGTDPNSGDISFDPSAKEGGFDVTGNRKRPKWIGLLHEMKHASDINKGVLDRAKWQSPDGTDVPMYEISATDSENKARAQSGTNLRHYYYTNGNGQGQLLDATNTRGSHPNFNTNYSNIDSYKVRSDIISINRMLHYKQVIKTTTYTTTNRIDIKKVSWRKY